MKILLTGMAGFIGSHTAGMLLDKGYQVAGVDNLCDFYSRDIKDANLATLRDKKGFSFYQKDIRDRDSLVSIFADVKPDIVIHLAAMAGVRPSIENPDLYTQVNITGTQNVLECMREHGTKKIVFASSSSVYGNNDKVPFSESDPVDHPISPYAATKKANELMLHTYHYLFDMDVLALRFFTVYGPRQRPDLAIHKFTRLISGGEKIPFYGDGSTERDYTFIEDILNGIGCAINYVNNNDKVYEVVNLGESRTVSLRELVSLLERTIGKDAILDRQPMQAGDVNRTFANIGKAKELLGYNPITPIEEGLKRFWQWYQENNR